MTEYAEVPIYGKRNGEMTVVAKAKIDPQDAELVSGHQWTLITGYAYANFPRSLAQEHGKQRLRMAMHRLILGLSPDDDLVCDHVDRDRLNNRRGNLRTVTVTENNLNRPGHSGRYKGIERTQGKGVGWRGRVTIGGSDCDIRLPIRSDEREAALDYDWAASILGGPAAYLNFPDEDTTGRLPLGLLVDRPGKGASLRSQLRHQVADEGDVVTMPIYVKEEVGKRTLVGEVLIDAADVALVARHRWYSLNDRYAYTRTPGGQTLTMHKLLMGDTGELMIDHINGNGFDNRRSNLRLVNHRQNALNQKPQAGRAYKGVVGHKEGFQARIVHDGRNIKLPPRSDPAEAARDYDWAASRLHGEYARLNLPDDLNLGRLDARLLEGKRHEVVGAKSSAGFRGVYAAPDGKFHAHLKVDGKKKHIGTFPTADAAARAYDEAVVVYHGASALLNYTTKIAN